MANTPVGEIPKIVSKLRKSFNAGRSRSYSWRQEQLSGLIRFVKEQEGPLFEALKKDLGKSEFEAFTAELAMVVSEAGLTKKNLKKWMRPKKVRTTVPTLPGKSFIMKEPLGVVLVIGAWNYPVQLTLVPLIGALAAGNCAVLKPSEVSPATSALLAQKLLDYLDPECMQVVEGAVDETSALLDQKFDHIFYTGNGTVGSIVAQAAAKQLASYTLELGGKSPCIVDRDTDLDVAARRIVWGKFYNAGQTCVAPDYVMAHKDVEGDLIEGMKKTLRDFYGDDPKESPDYARIVNERHHARLARLLESGEVAVGGDHDVKDRYIAPTILRNVPKDSAVMEDEIFGPILPVLKVDSIQEAIDYANSRPKPLALYLFSKNKHVQDQVLSSTSSGGVSVNHIMMHVANTNLPFGGVGPSGTGAYHGQASFEVFSHHKSVMAKPTFFDPAILYPPYTDSKFGWIKRLT